MPTCRKLSRLCAKLLQAAISLATVLLAPSLPGYSNSLNGTSDANFIGWLTNGPAVFRVTQVPGSQQRSNTFEFFLPGYLPAVVWTNLIAQTNGRDSVIWSVRTHPTNWPKSPPLVRWNTNCVLWGMKGLTALSPCWEDEGAPGQAPITLLTRRHGYTRGHSMGADGISSARTGKKVWFLTTNNVIVEAVVQRVLVRISEGRDYTILLFKRDLPDSIHPLRVESGTNLLWRYHPCLSAPLPVIKPEQSGQISLGLPGFIVNAWKPGDSGSPDLLPLPGELIFLGGRSTSSATPLMQRDINVLCRVEGLDPDKYQLQWADLWKFPSYPW